jgi:hypothetical protein
MRFTNRGSTKRRQACRLTKDQWACGFAPALRHPKCDGSVATAKIKLLSRLLIATVFLLAESPTLRAHHSFAKEFDDRKPVSLRGEITNIEWINPHVLLHIAVKDEDGNVVNWKIESGSPLALTRAGWPRDFFKIGDLVTVGGFQAKDGSRYASGLQVRRKGTPQVVVPLDQK